MEGPRKNINVILQELHKPLLFIFPEHCTYVHSLGLCPAPYINGFDMIYDSSLSPFPLLTPFFFLMFFLPITRVTPCWQ
jgi:hypothetical protein